MRSRRVVRRALGGLLAGVLATGLPHAGPSSPGTRYLVFIDLSSSTPQADRERWAAFVDARVIRRLRPGDAFTMYPIHDRTQEAGAIHVGEVPALPADPGIDAVAAASRALTRVRKAAREALDKVLAEGIASNQTDLLSALDRYQPDRRGRRMVVVFLSDMLHVGPDLNLERGRLTASTIGGILERLARERRWRSDQLVGAKVYCVLTAGRSGQARPVNDRRVLRQFYATLFEAVGARLMGFDTDVDLEEDDAWPGSAGGSR